MNEPLTLTVARMLAHEPDVVLVRLVVTFRFIDGRFFDAIHATVRLDGRPLPLRIVEAQHGAEPRLRVILISDSASDGWGVGIADGLATGLRRALVQADANTHRAVGPPW